MKHKIFDTPTILLILFFAFMYALIFSIRSVVIPLKQEVAALKTQQETEIIKGNKIYEIVKRY